MNIRKIYIGLIVFLLMGLFYAWTSETRALSTATHMSEVEYEKSLPTVSDDGNYISIENDLLKIRVAVKTGAIVEARLKKYKVENSDSALGSRVFGSDDSSLFKYYFKSGFTGQNLNYELDSYSDNFVILLDKEVGIRKKISFLPETYELSVTDSSINGVNGKAFASLYRTGGRSLDLKTNMADGGFMNSSSYEGVAISTEKDAYETTRLRSLDEPISELSRSGWIAFIEKYFFAALLGSEGVIYNYIAQPANAGIYSMGYTVEKPETQNLVYEHTHRLFIGPKIRKDLETRAENLELSIDMGWFWFISQPMVLFLDLINGVVGSWGLSIVIFTILLKLLLWPVTAKGYASMAGMRKVAPEMKELQERYKNDRQKLGTETMALYKKHNANPVGGCLPMLAQMPFFIGFFFALREMVELRHASLGFWLTDLSVPDPLFILPILFGMVMVLTQRLNPQPAMQDQTQAQVIKYMPVIFSGFFFVMPSALALYSVINSGVSLIQQRLIYKKHGANVDGS
jgi:YidC/Oxa1 family membrane protein insertase